MPRPRGDDLEERPDLVRRRRARRRRSAAPSRCSSSPVATAREPSRLSARACSTGVCGRIPWPRLKMCPGRPPARVEDRPSTRWRIVGGLARAARPGRGCPARRRRGRPRVHAGVEIHAPVQPDHVAAGRAHRGQERRGARPEVDDRNRRASARGSARACAAARTRGSRPARATPTHESKSWTASAPAAICPFR